jgi:serine/threonine-protein kinase RsbW
MDAVHAMLARVWEAMDRTLADPPGSLWRMYVATAAGEIAANIITHAYHAAPAGATAGLVAHLFPDRLTITFRDRGAPFPGDAPTVSGPGDLAESGRGIALARAAVDQLTYTRTPDGENVWTLEKRLAPDG